MSVLDQSLEEKVNFVKEVAEKKLRNLIASNAELINEEFEVIVKVKDLKGLGRKRNFKESHDFHKASLHIPNSLQHFKDNADNAEEHLNILNECQSSEEISIECKWQITKVIGQHILNVCPKASPAVMKPFVGTFLNGLSTHLILDEFFFYEKGNKRGSVWRFVRRETRNPEAGSTAKKSKRVKAAKKEETESEDEVVGEPPNVDASEKLEESGDDAATKLFKSLFSIKVLNRGVNSDSQSSVECIEDEELELPADPKSYVKENITDELFAELEVIRKSDPMPPQLLDAMSYMLAKSIVEQRKTVGKEAVLIFTNEFLKSCNYGVSIAKFTGKGAEPIMKQLRNILDATIQHSAASTETTTETASPTTEAAPSSSKSSSGFNAFKKTLMSRKRKLEDASEEENFSEEENLSELENSDDELMNETEKASFDAFLKFGDDSGDDEAADFRNVEENANNNDSDSEDEETSEENEFNVDNFNLQSENIIGIDELTEEAYEVVASLDTLTLIGERTAVTMANDWVIKIKAAILEKLDYCSDENKNYLYQQTFEERLQNTQPEDQIDFEIKFKELWENVKKFYLKRALESLEEPKFSNVGLYIKSQSLESIWASITSFYQYAAFIIRDPNVVQLEDVFGKDFLTKNLQDYKKYLHSGRKRINNRYTFVGKDYMADDRFLSGSLRRTLIALQFAFATIRCNNPELTRQKINVAERFKKRDDEFWENSAAMTYRDLQEFIHLKGIETYSVLKKVCLIGLMIQLGFRPSTIGKTVESFDGMLLSDVKIRSEHEKEKYSIQFRIRHEKVFAGNKNRRSATIMTVDEKYDLTRLFLIYLDARNAFEGGLAHLVQNNEPLIIDDKVMNEPLFIHESHEGPGLRAINNDHILAAIKDIAQGIGVPRRMVSSKSARRGHATDKIFMCLQKNPLMDLDEISKQLQVNEAWHSDVGLRYAFVENGFVKECHQRVRLLAADGKDVIPQDEFMHLYKVGQLGVERPSTKDPSVQALAKCLTQLYKNQNKSSHFYVLTQFAVELVHERRVKLAIENNTKPIPKEYMPRDPSTLSLIETKSFPSSDNFEIKLIYNKKCCFMDSTILNFLKDDAENIWLIGAFLSDTPNDIKSIKVHVINYLKNESGLCEKCAESFYEEEFLKKLY